MSRPRPAAPPDVPDALAHLSDEQLAIGMGRLIDTLAFMKAVLGDLDTLQSAPDIAG